MADLAWSERRKALIPGKYENGFFVPFNGDDPIPQEAVVASQPPLTIKAIDNNGDLRDMRPADAFRAAGARDIRRVKHVAPWIAVIFLAGLGATLIFSPRNEKRNLALPAAAAPKVSNNMDLSPGIPKTAGMTIALLRSAGDKKGIDCHTDNLLLASLQRLQNRVFPGSATLERGIKTVSIDGGSAKLVGFRRAFQPGDRDVIESDEDFYLVSPECFVLPL